MSKKYKCPYCQYEWISRKRNPDKNPRACPRCHTRTDWGKWKDKLIVLETI